MMKTNEFSTPGIYKNACMVVQKLPDSLPIQHLQIAVESKCWSSIAQNSTAQHSAVQTSLIYFNNYTNRMSQVNFLCEKEILKKWVENNEIYYFNIIMTRAELMAL